MRRDRQWHAAEVASIKYARARSMSAQMQALERVILAQISTVNICMRKANNYVHMQRSYDTIHAAVRAISLAGSFEAPPLLA